MIWSLYRHKLDLTTKTLPPKFKIPLSLLVLCEDSDSKHELTGITEREILRRLSLDDLKNQSTSWPISNVNVIIMPPGCSVDGMKCSMQVGFVFLFSVVEH